jgi:hypothetical protein
MSQRRIAEPEENVRRQLGGQAILVDDVFEPGTVRF